jgi:hypothetical protein
MASCVRAASGHAATAPPRSDPEELRDIIGAYHRRCAEVITGSGGFVAKYLGHHNRDNPRLGGRGDLLSDGLDDRLWVDLLSDARGVPRSDRRRHETFQRRRGCVRHACRRHGSRPHETRRHRHESRHLSFSCRTRKRVKLYERAYEACRALYYLGKPRFTEILAALDQWKDRL